ncbi:MAG: glyoxylate/hydroxypyruvate reductase A, partial [Betaproteobacteria bacterium]|nr:glyoxylate/hydroxypyruvate reductase A [Betaproteobacteria bacterium]
WPVGVMGMGSIGAVIARAVAGFDYPVQGWSRSPKAMDGFKVYAGRDELDAFLAATRVLVLALPLTADTRHVVDAQALATLRDGALVINVGRGALIDDGALLAALDAGKVARAALDVFAAEPLPDGHAYWTHPKVTVTPHISGTTLIAPGVAQIVAKIEALERGDPVDGIVDLERGY